MSDWQGYEETSVASFDQVVAELRESLPKARGIAALVLLEDESGERFGRPLICLPASPMSADLLVRFGEILFRAAAEMEGVE